MRGDDGRPDADAWCTLLGLSPLQLSARSIPYDHLNVWVAALERAGVLVMATSRGQIPTQEMRAFSLYFDHLPVIMVNGADGARGRLFSLLREYAHLLLHTNGSATPPPTCGRQRPSGSWKPVATRWPLPS